MAADFAVDCAPQYSAWMTMEKLKLTRQQPEENQGAVQDAIDSCPVSAIVWDE